MSQQADLAIIGDVVTPEAVIAGARLDILDGRILRIVSASGDGVHDLADGVPPARKVVDARGRLVLAGAVDAHVHCYSEPEEGFARAGQAAAAGGVTTIVEMPYDTGRPVVDAATLAAKVERLVDQAVVDIALLGTIRKVDGVKEIPGLVEGGICGLKVSLFESDPHRFPRIADNDLVAAFSEMATVGMPVCVHAENGEIIEAMIAEARMTGRTYPQAHAESRPPVSETSAVALALELAATYRTPLHVCHASLAASVDLVASYRSRGFPVSVETCPHYLMLNETDMDVRGARAKINPPLRKAAQVEALWQRVRSGAVDFIASDHSPWSLGRKAAPVIFDNASGIPGVETLVPLLLDRGWLSGRLSLLDCTRLLAENPAHRFGLYPRKGQIAPGADADLVIFNPSVETVVRGEKLHSSADWTPYEGWRLRGRVEATYLRGQIIAIDGEVVAEPGTGRFLRPP